MAPKAKPAKAKAKPESGVTIQGLCDAVKGQVVQVRRIMRSLQKRTSHSLHGCLKEHFILFTFPC